jgi:hypothetical protein
MPISRNGGCSLRAPTTKTTVMSPKKAIPFAMIPNVSFQSSNQITSATGKAHQCMLMPVTSWSARHTPPIYEASTKKVTSTTGSME